MEAVFQYGKCIFTKPNVNNVDDMVEMMNNERIASMLSTKKRVYTREMEIEWIRMHQEDHTFSVYDRETSEYIGNCGFNENRQCPGRDRSYHPRSDAGKALCEGYHQRAG